MRKIKIAQIGAMHDHAPGVFPCMASYPDVFEILGYCAPDGRKPEYDYVYEGYKEYSVEEIFDIPGLEAVTIETGEHNLTKYAIEAAKRGLHIHMDKPGGINSEEFDELIEIVKEKNLVFSIGYMYRFNPAVIEAKKLVKSGALGDIYAVEAHMDCYHPKDKRQWLEKFPGGMMFYLGCHLIDLVLQFMGQPERIVPMNKIVGNEGTTSEDYGFATFEYKNGVSFVKTCATEPGGYLRRQLVLCGTKGTVEIKPFEYPTKDGICTDMRVCQSTVWEDGGEKKTLGPIKRYDDMMLEFAKEICGESKRELSLEYEKMLHKAVLKSCGINV